MSSQNSFQFSESSTVEGRTDKRGQHQSCGFPGKLQAARSSAPEGVSEDVILSVASQAHQEEREASEVWRERSNHGLCDFGGESR